MGSLVPRPHSHAGRAWEQGKFNFLFCFRRNSSFWISFCVSFGKGKRKKECIIMNSFLFSSEKEKRNQSFYFLQINEKGMYDLEFILCFFQKKEKGMHKSEFVFLFCSEKGKGTRVSEFRFSFFRRKEKGNTPRKVDFSFPGTSNDDEISWNSFSRKLIY